MMTKQKTDWLAQYQEIGERIRAEARGKPTLNELEALVEKHQEDILKTVMQGIVDDKGNGKELKPQGAKNKGVKKKT